VSEFQCDPNPNSFAIRNPEQNDPTTSIPNPIQRSAQNQQVPMIQTIQCLTHFGYKDKRNKESAIIIKMAFY